MLMNLTEVFQTEGRRKEASVDIEMDVFKCRKGSFDIISKTPVSFVLENTGPGRALVTGNAKLSLLMSCDRCLKDVPEEIELSISQEFTSQDYADSESADEEDQGVLEGYQMNVEALVYNEILMNLPEKVLCKPDCKGICKQCGKDLNDGDCGCDTFVPDPRMAVLQDIFNANKEV